MGDHRLVDEDVFEDERVALRRLERLDEAKRPRHVVLVGRERVVDDVELAGVKRQLADVARLVGVGRPLPQALLVADGDVGVRNGVESRRRRRHRDVVAHPVAERLADARVAESRRDGAHEPHDVVAPATDHPRDGLALAADLDQLREAHDGRRRLDVDEQFDAAPVPFQQVRDRRYLAGALDLREGDGVDAGREGGFEVVEPEVGLVGVEFQDDLGVGEVVVCDDVDDVLPRRGEVGVRHRVVEVEDRAVDVQFRCLRHPFRRSDSMRSSE